jgi:hypothetical protein
MMFGITSRRRRWVSMLILLLVIGVGGVIGCGGSGGTSIAPVGSNTPATTKGSYTFTIAGTDSSDPTIATSTSFTINVL